MIPAPSPGCRRSSGSLLIYRRRTCGPVFMATTVNDKLMYVVLVAAIVAGLYATALGLAGRRAYDYRQSVSIWFRSIWIPATARRSDGRGSALLPGPRDDRPHVVRLVAVHPVGARVQRADRLSVPALRRLPQPRYPPRASLIGSPATPGLVITMNDGQALDILDRQQCLNFAAAGRPAHFFDNGDPAVHPVNFRLFAQRHRHPSCRMARNSLLRYSTRKLLSRPTSSMPTAPQGLERDRRRSRQPPHRHRRLGDGLGGFVQPWWRAAEISS